MNLFMQYNHSWSTQDSCTTQIGKIGYDWHQKHVKKIWKICHGNQILFSSMQRSFDWKLNPNPSSYKCDQNLMPRNQKAAPHLKNKVGIFFQIFKNWNHNFKEFQGKILTPLHSWSISEHSWIKATSFNTKNW